MPWVDTVWEACRVPRVDPNEDVNLNGLDEFYTVFKERIYGFKVKRGSKGGMLTIKPRDIIENGNNAYVVLTWVGGDIYER